MCLIYKTTKSSTIYYIRENLIKEFLESSPSLRQTPAIWVVSVGAKKGGCNLVLPSVEWDAVRTLVQTSYIVRWDRWPPGHRFVPFGCGLVVNSAPTRQSSLSPHRRPPANSTFYFLWLLSCEGLSPTAWWVLSLPLGHSQKARIDDREVIDLSVLYSLSGPGS